MVFCRICQVKKMMVITKNTQKSSILLEFRIINFETTPPLHLKSRGICYEIILKEVVKKWID